MNANDWWTIVDDNKDDLLDCIARFHPNMHQTHDFAITAPRAEKACEVVREEIRNNSDGRDPLGLAEKYINNRDRKLLKILNATWFGAPESRSVYFVPGFGVLCDLCSEGYVLYGEDEYDDETL